MPKPSTVADIFEQLRTHGTVPWQDEYKPSEEDKMEYWYFTFGYGQEHGPNGYCKIQGTYREAREEMVRRHGIKWAFQYSEDQFAGQVEKYNLHEVV